MKFLAPALTVFSMVCFTDPRGFAFWADRNQVVSVSRPAGECALPSKARVTLGNGTFVCIQETVKEALQRLDPVSK
jgi:hypothetical protein